MIPIESPMILPQTYHSGNKICGRKGIDRAKQWRDCCFSLLSEEKWRAQDGKINVCLKPLCNVSIFLSFIQQRNCPDDTCPPALFMSSSTNWFRLHLPRPDNKLSFLMSLEKSANQVSALDSGCVLITHTEVAHSMFGKDADWESRECLR